MAENKKERNKRHFGAALTYFIKDGGYGSASKFAEKAGISSAYIGQIAKGEKRGDIDVLERIASLFNLSYQEMITFGQYLDTDGSPYIWLQNNHVIKKEATNNYNQHHQTRAGYSASSLTATGGSTITRSGRDSIMSAVSQLTEKQKQLIGRINEVGGEAIIDKFLAQLDELEKVIKSM